MDGCFTFSALRAGNTELSKADVVASWLAVLTGYVTPKYASRRCVKPSSKRGLLPGGIGMLGQAPEDLATAERTSSMWTAELPRESKNGRKSERCAANQETCKTIGSMQHVDFTPT